MTIIYELLFVSVLIFVVLGMMKRQYDKETRWMSERLKLEGEIYLKESLLRLHKQLSVDKDKK